MIPPTSKAETDWIIRAVVRRHVNDGIPYEYATAIVAYTYGIDPEKVRALVKPAAVSR